MPHYGILIFKSDGTAYFSSHQFSTFPAASSDWSDLLSSDCTGWSLGTDQVNFAAESNLAFYDTFYTDDMSPTQVANITTSIPSFYLFAFATW